MSTEGQDGQHVSMLAYRGFGQKLVSKRAALDLARAVLRDNFGDAAFSRQGDLVATDAGDWWQISSTYESTCSTYDASADRKFDIEISQFDGRIRKLTFV